MRLTKFGHACVRVEHAGVRVVIDPGGFTDRGAVDGADAVLITHQHADHYDADEAPQGGRHAPSNACVFWMGRLDTGGSGRRRRIPRTATAGRSRRSSIR